MKRILQLTLPIIAGLGIGSNATAANVVMHTPESFELLSMSPNGQWACGVYVDAAQGVYGFRWNLQSGTIEMLGDEESTAWDVANDGTVSGDCLDPRAMSNGAPTTMPAYWRNGQWHYLEMPAGKLVEGLGSGISTDGRYMTGAISVDGKYRPYIWKDGAIHRTLDTGKDAVAFTISPDGESAAGYSTQYNRTVCYWQQDGNVMFFNDTEYSQGPWSYARNFSPDGTKLLYWGGWELVNDEDLYLHSAYDITTGEKIKIKMLSMDSDAEFFDISNSGKIVGGDRGRGVVVCDGQVTYIDDYLQALGVDISDFDDFYDAGDYYENELPIFRVMAISEDESVLAMNYYNTGGQICSMVLKIGADFTHIKPVEISARQLEGLNTVALTWKRPYGAEGIRGYNIYRDGRKVNGFVPVNALSYYDSNLDPGTYSYEISAVTVDGTETRAEAFTVEVATPQSQSPYALFGRQKGINSAYLTWRAPMSNIVHKRYFDQDFFTLKGFSVYVPVVAEMAVKYDAAEMLNYKDYKISEVSFYPMAQQKGWSINLYTVADGVPTLVHSEPVTQELQYKQLNRVALSTPIDIPAGDLLVAVECTTNGAEYQVLGAATTNFKAGYTDLLRQKEETDFYSAYESSAASGYSISCVNWAIDLGLTKDGEEVITVDKYNIYNGETLIGTTTDTEYIASSLADGDYRFAVEAVYADHTTAPQQTATVSISGNYPAIESVNVDTGEEGSTVITATWEHPVDNDPTPISYTTATKPSMGIMGTSSNDYALTIGAEYKPEMLRGYDGYKFKSFRFYPMTDALFTFLLFENDEFVYELEVDDYTVNQWNEIELPDDIYVNEGSTYRLAVDCFNPTPATKVFGIDNDAPYTLYSDQYTQDGETWESLSLTTGARGNWLIGMTIAQADAPTVDIDGYDVAIDYEVRNDQRIKDNHFTYDMGKTDDMRHSVHVNIYYTAKSEVVKGKNTYFYLSTAGLADNMVGSVRLNRGDNYLVAQGEGVTRLEVYSTNGALMASADGERVNISSLSSGIYIVKINVNGKSVTRKINIIK